MALKLLSVVIASIFPDRGEGVVRSISETRGTASIRYADGIRHVPVQRLKLANCVNGAKNKIKKKGRPTKGLTADEWQEVERRTGEKPEEFERRAQLVGLTVREAYQGLCE